MLEIQDEVMILGSCFAENIGNKLKDGGISTHVNPLGIQYNPLSMEKNLRYFAGLDQFNPNEIFEQAGRFRHWDLHSRLCGTSKRETVEMVELAIAKARRILKKTTWVYLTLGTAHVWFHDNRPVANCHKVPNNEFERKRLSTVECLAALNRMVDTIRQINDGANILLTVSPVRYKRDGLVSSGRSKAALLLASEELCNIRDRTHYFPAYEMLIDDLRDYRFYERDLVHPSNLAIDYIWQKFQQCAISSKAIEHVDRTARQLRQQRHKPHEKNAKE
jgi:hypothetical protein